MIARPIALLFGCLLFIAGTTSAQADAGIEGNWSGSYSCNGQVAQLTLRNTQTDSIFEFAYPDGTSGSYTIDIKVDEKRGSVTVKPLAWLDKPPGFYMIGLKGSFSKDGKSISGRATGGCNEFSVANPDAPPRDKTSDPAARPSEPEAVAQAGVASSKGPKPEGSPPVPSAWESDFGCHYLKSIRVSFQQPDADGFDVMLRVLEPKATEYTVLRARSAPGRHNFGLQITAEPAESGPLRRDPLMLTTSPMTHPERLVVNIRSPNCGEVRLVTAKDEAPVQEQDLPSELSALLGAWDGAAYFRKSGKAIPIALTIEVSGSSVKGRFLDATLTVDGVAQPSALFGDGNRIELKPVERSRTTYDAGLYTRIKDGGAGGDVITGVLLDREPLSMYLWRRPTGETRSMADLCKTYVDDLAAHRKRAIDAANWLKQEFYPALETMKPDAAADHEIRLVVAMREDADEVKKAAAFCAITEPSGRSSGAAAMAALAGIERLDLLRQDIGRGAGKSALSSSFAALPDPASAIAAEDALRQEAALVPESAPPDAVLAAVGELRSLIDDARPTVARTILAPLQLRLRMAESQGNDQLAQERGQAAKQIMKGLSVPPLPPDQAEMIAAVSEGRRSAFSQTEMLFLAGMLAESVETCKVLDPEVGLRLSGLMMQGATLAMGTEFANPDLGTGIGSNLGNTAIFARGVDFVRGIGCTNAWLAGFYKTLALAIDTRSQGKKSSVFLRSCALHHSSDSCKCAMGVLEPFFPGLAERDYDRSMLTRVGEMNPAAALTIFAQCRIGDY